MAIYYCKVTNISRGGGRSAVGSAAYRANEKIKNEFDGRIHNYTNKHDIAYKEIMAPDNAPWWVQSRKKLWNEVEKMEKASNSRLAREITIALPKELTKEQQIELAREYCREALVSQGMIADLCIHDKGDGNPHAHIMVTTRGFNEHGQWLPKSRKEYIRDEFGERIQLKSGEWKSRKIDINDWNTTERLKSMREQWAIVANRYLPEELHIDHRSYEEQEIDKIGMVHMGHGSTALERNGIETEKGNLNREIQEFNEHIEQINQEVEKADREISEINQEIEAREIQEQNKNIEQLDQEVEKADREISEINKDIHAREKMSMEDRMTAAKEKAEQTKEEKPQHRERQWEKSLEEKEKLKPVEVQEPKQKQNIAADQPSQIRAPENPENRTEIADAVKERLLWQRESIKLELEISEKCELKGELNTSIRNIENHIEDIYKKTGNIEHWIREIEKLQERKQSLNIFQGKEKKAIEEQIRNLEQPIAQVGQNLERDYGIKPEQAQAKLDELSMQRSELIKKIPSQADIELLKDRQEKMILKYQISMQELELRPDREKIMELMKKFPPNRGMTSRQESIIAAFERKLNNPGKAELERMLKFVPEKSDLSELIKDKITSIAMSKIKTIHHMLER